MIVENEALKAFSRPARLPITEECRKLSFRMFFRRESLRFGANPIWDVSTRHLKYFGDLSVRITSHMANQVGHLTLLTEAGRRIMG